LRFRPAGAGHYKPKPGALMLFRSAFALTFALALALPASAAPPSPRDEALRLAPTDFALVVVVQNLREHVTAVSESPFASWFPTSTLGKKLLNGTDFKRITDSATPLFGALGITPSDLFHDIIGDAVVFAYTPAPAGEPKGERSLILIRPGKPDTLAKVIDRINKGQTESKELKSLIERKHAGAVYFERQKPEGPSDFYCFRGGVFAFSGSETEIKAVIDRSNAATDKPPLLVERMTKLGVSDAAVAFLIHPRALDNELAAKVKNAKPDEKAFLTKFAEVWTATDAAAIYFALDTGVELGVSLQFNPAKLPATAKGWLVGERTLSALWNAVPDNALFAVAGRVKPNDLLDFLTSIAPPGEKKGVRETIEETLGPIVGRDKLPLVLDALGPDWGVWIVPLAKGAKDTTIPVAVAAVKVQTDGPKGAEASKALVQALEDGFRMVRLAYNTTHKDQLELREEKDGDALIKSLSGNAFPAGVRPSFALKGGYLVLATSPDAIKAFKAPTGELKVGGDVLLARFNATAARDYLSANALPLAKLLAAAGAGEEKALAEQLGGLAAVLEPVEKVELLARGDATGLKLLLRTKPVKPLKK
jgi:hypothetical protein